MSYKIIVARYNENISWLNSELHNCIIYNKGDKLNINENKNIITEIMLDNVGRESDSYLQYIITNYYNLPDVIVFTQANISDHKKDNLNYLIKIKNEAISQSKSQNFMTYNDTNVPIYFNKIWNLLMKDFNSVHNCYYKKEQCFYKNNIFITFFEWFKTNIHQKYPDPIHIYLNAIFAVRKEIILNKPIEYYKKLLLEVNYTKNPIEGHFFERSWYYIFD
jgi:hypothetical protein